ncbi:MAG: pyruvate ferredoxin oxidoreductase [Gammaproteobacteria bacterium]|nr:pyruvate ferredoxin oxidoreductase [Gammaproteobacteria bacterium]MBU1654796.1 pyruvate ferredoxin oxidoreductase [Gammaproteobacteria bacterium]MBU1961447.1 pyruvate ferredoxin oxidoreductase [Gammaproteobacteria bacterium]
MSTMNKLAIRLYRRLFGVPVIAALGAKDGAVVMDGNCAVALTEAALADAIALGGGSSALTAELTWRESGHNCFGGPLNSIAAEGPRGALAAAIGQAMTGCRTTLFLSGAELTASQDLLRTAAGRRLPLVVHLINRAAPAQGEAQGSGHEALHLAAESGCLVMVAANVQEAVDFTLIARKVAELALVPALVAMDYEQTALSAQDVRLPSAELIKRYLGAADGAMPSPCPAQELLYGKQRRRMPRLHDPDSAQLQGAVQDRDSFALGAMAGPAFFDGHFDGMLQGAFDEFADLTGRRYAPLSAHCVDESERVLVALGSAIETAKTVADRLSGKKKERVGVVGIHCLRPFPGAGLVGLLSGKRWVAVMERLVSPLNATPPLLRELRCAFDAALDEKRITSRPRLQSVAYGVGGLPVKGQDLMALIGQVQTSSVPTLYLGINFHANLPEHPKRQVMLDQLRRAYPQIATLGVTGPAVPEAAETKGMLSLGFLHAGDAASRTLPAAVGGLLQRIRGGFVRALPGLEGDAWQSRNRDLLVQSTTGLSACEENGLANALLLNGATALQGLDLSKEASQGAVLLFTGLDVQGGTSVAGGRTPGATDSSTYLLQALGTANREAIRSLGLKPYFLPTSKATLELDSAWLTGGMFGALAGAEIIDLSARKIATAWKDGLAALSDKEQEVLADRFKEAMETVQPLELDATGKAAVTSASWSDEPPIAVRHLGGNDGTNESLPRFWDQVGVLYRNGEDRRLTADPYMATGSIPPLSATFQDHGARVGLGIAFDAESCTGCGDCFVVCPDSAIGVSAATPARLIETAIGFTAADALRPLAGKLGARINAMGRAGDFKSATASSLLGTAWAWMQEKAPLPEERRVNVEAALDLVRDWLGDLPLVVTDNLFHSGEKAKKDGGELLTLAINPDACKGCGLCVAECGEGALAAAPWDKTQAKTLWRGWEQSPDTLSETIERLAHDAQGGASVAGGRTPGATDAQGGASVAGGRTPRATDALNTMAALMMSRYCSHALSGGDFAEAGSGERLALRLMLATAEYQQQPLLHQFTAELGEAKKRVNALIRDTLADALPTDDLDRLVGALRGDQGLDLPALVKSAEKTVDTHRARELIELAKALHDQHWCLSAGRHGLGRARYGLAISTGTVATWAAAFPNNPFQAPVAVDMTGDAGQLAAGLVQGQAVETIRAINLLSKARHLLGDSREAPSELGWDELSDEQRRLCPPLILVGNEKELGGRGLAQVTWLLNSGLPVKVLMLSELDLGLDTRGAKTAPLDNLNDPRTDLGLLALAQRNAYVAQSSIAEPGHLRRSVRNALRYGGPALIRVHAPSPGRHGFASDRTLAQARLAVQSRVLPLFRYDPEGKGVFGSRIDLDGNIDPNATWQELLTPAHWAQGETRFAAHLQPLTEADKSPLDLIAWLALDANGRKGKTPMATLGEKTYRVSLEFAERVEHVTDGWRMLQELAGLVTPFTERVRREAEAAVAQAHQAELAALKADYENRLREQSEGVQAELAGRVKERLLNLAGYH